MIKISIIMPLYNAEKYLEESLQSIFRQTFSHFELICINDGSADGTLDILKKYVKMDSRIRIIDNEKRLGAAYSRNRGIKEAKGKYLSFLDGDDVFDETMLETAFVDAEMYDADIVMFNGKHVPTEDIYHSLYMIHGKEYTERYCKSTFSVIEQEPFEFLNWTLAPWNKLFRREFILLKELEFQSLSCANDVYFVVMALMLAERIHVLSDSRVMVYARDHFEPSRISYNRDPMCTYLAMEKIIIELKNRNELENFYHQFYWSAIFAVINAISISKNKKQARSFYDFMKREGVGRLRKLGEQYYQTVDEYVEGLFRNFEEKPYESEWYKDESIIKVHLYKKNSKVEKIFRDYEKKGIQIGIWGAGRNGQALIKYCNEHKIKLAAVIDKNKGGKKITLCGHKVCSPEECYDKVQAIIIASQFIYEDVQKSIEASGKKIELIDINRILQIA